MKEPRAFVEAVGKAIRELREERDLSQMALWRRCNTHFNYIGGIERGEREPSVRAIADIANGLDVEVIEVFARADRLLDG